MPDRHDFHLPEKVNRILQIILLFLFLILLRVWHLAVIQYNEKLEQSRKPQYRTVLEPAKRGTIRDRFNQPLAVNTMKYNAAILYAHLRQIPSIAWKKDEKGKKIKVFKRKRYIARLSKLLGEELQLDPLRIEDLIHAKASFYTQMPFVIKEDISEKEYYRLKILEKDWLGIHVQRLPRRSYPLAKVGSDIVGYMGAINREEYERILQEISSLESFLEAESQCLESGIESDLPLACKSIEEAEKRLKTLREQAYSLNDTIGKAGIERSYERLLRGQHGKKTYYSDARGNFLREMPEGRPPLSGQRLLLTVSAELQEFAEKILAQNEKIRLARISTYDSIKQTLASLHQPWIKGGAIIAIEPTTGEVLALASYPRYDPNDFIMTADSEKARFKKRRIGRWLESEQMIADIWDQKQMLEREFYDNKKEKFCEESILLTWENYLQRILPKEHALFQALHRVATLDQAVALQKLIGKLLELTEQSDARLLLNQLYTGVDQHPFSLHQKALPKLENSSCIDSLKQEAFYYFAPLPRHYDKLLLVDLCRLCVCAEDFGTALLLKKGKESLSCYRQASTAKEAIEALVKEMTFSLFKETTFLPWRKENEKKFLKQKREEEKSSRAYQRPYTDYLDAKEEELFKEFWTEHRWALLYTFLTGRKLSENDLLQPYEEHLLEWYREIAQGAHREIPWMEKYQHLQKSISELEASLAIEYLKTMRGYKELNRPLLGRYRALRSSQNGQLEKHLAAAFYPKWGFGYGRSHAFRQAAPQGSIFKLVTAYAALNQRYEEIGNPNIAMQDLNPLEMVDKCHRLGNEIYIGYDKEGVPIPRHYKGGRLPRSPGVKGKLDLLKALETSSNPYFSLLAGDLLHNPEDLVNAARLLSYGTKTGIGLPAEISGQLPDDLEYNRTGLYAMAIGQHTFVVTPLQTAMMLTTFANGGLVLSPQIVRAFIQSGNSAEKTVKNVRWEISLPAIVRKTLLEGMRRVVTKTKKESLARLSRMFREYPEAIQAYESLSDEFIGKTSTAEIMENVSLDEVQGTNLYKHVWFGGIAFRNAREQDPELVVVVYLRFGIYGKEAAPIAAQIVKKWREIKSRHACK